MYEQNEIITNIKVNLNAFSESERKVAEFIISNSIEASKMTTQEIANAVMVSKPTVSRFVKCLGYNSFRNFQNSLNYGFNAKNGETMVYSDISDVDSNENICRKVFENNIRASYETLSIIDVDAINKIVELIRKARCINVFGQGRSAIVAEAFKNRFYRFGINCNICSDAHTQAVISAISNKDDLIIGISTFGRSRSVIKALKRAKENCTPTVAITGFSDTPIEEYADYSLKVVSSKLKNQSYEPSGETTAMITLIDCLYMLYIVKEEQKVKQCFYKSNIAIEEEKVSRLIK